MRLSTSLLSLLGRFLLYTVILFSLALVIYIAYQDSIVREQFEGKKWSLPAHVYAAPTTVFVGAYYNAENIEWILQSLQFRNDTSLSSQGTYVRVGNEIVLRTRNFRFWDKEEPAREIRIQFENGQISLLEDVNEGHPLPLLRLEPVRIGSFYPALKEDRILIKLDQVPSLLLNALFATEDHHFYTHHGVSLRGILRAVWVNMQAGDIVQGGSTLTQQLVKNFFLNAERTWWRKVNEIIMSVILDARYTKDDILEAYLNEIYLGQDGARAIHGFGLAGQYYFGRSLEELHLHHVALLVSLVRGPSYYDPFTFPDRAKKRRDLVLHEMQEQGYIDDQQAAEAQNRPLDVLEHPHQSITRYPAFLDLVRRELRKDYRQEDMTSEGLHLFTTLDVGVQHVLEESISSTLKKLDAHAPLQGAAIVTRRATGEIVGLVGDRSVGASGFNRALDATRQIGSLYKPIVYLTAFEQRPAQYTVLSPLQDTAIQIKNPGSPTWTPKNFDQREHGIVPLHQALSHSYNLATVRLGMEIGIAYTAKTLRKCGVDTPVEQVPSLLLGTASLTPFHVARIYQTLANEGLVTPLRAIQSVVSQDGKPLQRTSFPVEQSFDPGNVYLVNTILKEVMREGTGKAAYAVLPSHLTAAGKTGTTNDLRDSWFAGFTGDYLGVVWVGRDDNQPTRLTGALGALKVWTSIWSKISHEPLNLEPPDNVEHVWIDQESGFLSDENCPVATVFPFIRGTAPAERSSCGAEREENSFTHSDKQDVEEPESSESGEKNGLDDLF